MIDKHEQELINAVKTAREHGDLSENAEYHAAREALALYRSRRQADEQAKKAAELNERQMKEEANEAIQELLDSGMTLDDIKATMPWMIK
mgnify:CR=1 FL=1